MRRCRCRSPIAPTSSTTAKWFIPARRPTLPRIPSSSINWRAQAARPLRRVMPRAPRSRWRTDRPNRAKSAANFRGLNMADQELATLTATEASQCIAGGELSAEEYVGACLDKIAALESAVHAFIHLDPDHALAQARALDERQREGEPLGALHGIPVAIKDIFDTKDYPTECGSPLCKGNRPSRDAGSVARLRAAGAVIIGKSVTTEFAYHHAGATRNPHDPERTPGGSSSGSAAAVAAGMVPLATGSQTNGSVIRPETFCGVYGVKPTHGTISRARTLILSRALDHVGVFARSLADCALILDVLAGYDAEDPDSRSFAAPAFRAMAEEMPLSSPRFAFVRTPVWDKADAETRAAFEA